MENRSLVFDLVEWIAKNQRPYNEVMDAWRTSCPRLSVWEEATDHSFVERITSDDNQAMVRVTEKGLEFLETERDTAQVKRSSTDDGNARLQ